MTNRLFVALNLPLDEQKRIVSLRNEFFGEQSEFRWEPIEKFHITLKFLGDVPAEKNSEIQDVLNQSLAEVLSFRLKTDKFGVFNRNGKPSILWAGFDRCSAIENLAATIDDAFEKFGFSREKRKFKPHVTLLRIKPWYDAAKIIEFSETEPSFSEFHADLVTLYESKLLPKKSVYYKIKEYNLV